MKIHGDKATKQTCRSKPGFACKQKQRKNKNIFNSLAAIKQSQLILREGNLKRCSLHRIAIVDIISHPMTLTAAD